MEAACFVGLAGSSSVIGERRCLLVGGDQAAVPVRVLTNWARKCRILDNSLRRRKRSSIKPEKSLPSDRRHHSGNPKGASCFISVVDRSEDGTSPALRGSFGPSE